eukprot:Nitzschia sp. Nitz4//scaffold321_size20361//1898//3796//NITZ4_008681-RA/size20361-processed-gene-0.29-mRNA-1//1//CDS//3329547769//4737//frame0
MCGLLIVSLSLQYCFYVEMDVWNHMSVEYQGKLVTMAKMEGQEQDDNDNLALETGNSRSSEMNTDACSAEEESSAVVSPNDESSAGDEERRTESTSSVARLPEGRSLEQAMGDGDMGHDRIDLEASKASDRASMPLRTTVPGAVAVHGRDHSGKEQEEFRPQSQFVRHHEPPIPAPSGPSTRNSSRVTSTTSATGSIPRCSDPVRYSSASSDSDSDFGGGSDVQDATPTVQAELVCPPIEAMHVTIDEEPPSRGRRFRSLEMESAPSPTEEDGWWKVQFSLAFVVGIAVGVIIVVCAILIPIILREQDRPQKDISDGASAYPYDCFTTVRAILRDQLVNEDIPSVYIVCPNTTIQVGNFKNLVAGDYSFVGGDYPLMAFRENVVIQCGLNGSSDNNCVFVDGFAQVLTSDNLPSPLGGVTVTTPIDNFTIRGMTFSGQAMAAGSLDGNSVILSHPGKNIRLEDCIWKNITAPYGLITVAENSYQTLTDFTLEHQSIEVTFSECQFRDIIYDKPLIYVQHQDIRIERSEFRDITMSVLVESHCDLEADMSFADECTSLMTCRGNSICALEEVCLSNFQFGGPALIQTTQDTYSDFSKLYLETIQGAADCDVGVQENATSVTCDDIQSQQSCPL